MEEFEGELLTVSPEPFHTLNYLSIPFYPSRRADSLLLQPPLPPSFLCFFV